MMMHTPENRLQDQLLEALQAHGQWKHRLRQAAVRKEQDLPVERICRDDCCKFGLWVSSLPPEVLQSREAQEVMDLHRQFHLAAGGVAKMIREGRTNQALSRLASGDYPRASKALTDRVARWRMRQILTVC